MCENVDTVRKLKEELHKAQEIIQEFKNTIKRLNISFVTVPECTQKQLRLKDVINKIIN